MKISIRTARRGLSGAIFLSVLAFLAITLATSRRDLIAAWRQISWLAMAAGAVAISLTWLSKAARMYVIGRAMGARIGFGRFLQIYLTTCFVSHVTPFSAGGVPMQVYLIHREGASLGMATALTTVDLGLNLVVILAVIPIVLSLGRGGFTYRPPGWLGWLLAGLALIVLAGVLWQRLRRRRIARRAGRLADRWREEYRLFRAGMAAMARCGAWPFLAAIGFTFAYWLTYLAVAPIILIGLGVKFPLGYILLSQLVFNFLQVLFPTPGGSGGSELLLLSLSAPLVHSAQGGVFVMLWKLYTFYSTLILGGLLFWRLLSRERVIVTGEAGETEE